MVKIAFEAVAVDPMDTNRVLQRQTVLVEGDRIIGIGPAHETPSPSGAVRIDGRGRFLMPGLADMHTHVSTEGDLLLHLAHGVTTVRNTFGMPRHLLWADRAARGEAGRAEHPHHGAHR